ncbi:MAG: radical SAM protein [Cyanobacterium sp.]
MENKKIQPTRYYAKSFHQALGILVTMKCPLECAHCGIESSPRREEVLDQELIVSRLREIGKQGKIKQLIITGGEPFAVRPLLHSILEVALEYDIYTYVQSSGFWASSKERAIATLTPLPRITHLGISADEYHESFVPLQYVKNAVEAALECGMLPEISLRVWDMDNDPFLQHFYNVIGQDLLEQVYIDFEKIIPLGRGTQFLSVEQIQKNKIDHFPEGACNLAHHASVDCDGKVLACCNTRMARKYPALQLGDLNEKSFTQMTNEAEENYLLQAIRVWGPKRLAEIVIKHGMGDRLKDVYEKDSICLLCTDLLSKPEIVELLTEVLNTPEVKEELILSRLLRYGEISKPLEHTLELVSPM